MTTESEVTLPEALAWLKSLSGDYAAKIDEFIQNKISNENYISFSALNKCADNLQQAWESGFVDKPENEACDVENMIRSHAFDNYHPDGYKYSDMPITPSLDELRNWGKLISNKAGAQ